MIKKNIFNLVLFLTLLLIIFKNHLFLSVDKNKIYFGKIGSNYFLKTFNGSIEYDYYLNQIYIDFLNKSSVSLCIQTKLGTYQESEIAKIILNEKKMPECD